MSLVASAETSAYRLPFNSREAARRKQMPRRANRDHVLCTRRHIRVRPHTNLFLKMDHANHAVDARTIWPRRIVFHGDMGGLLRSASQVPGFAVFPVH